MEEIWHEINGYRIFCRFLKAKNPIATVMFIHGLGEHCGRYSFQKYVDKSISVYTWDQIGFGKTAKENKETPLGHNGGFNAVMSQCKFIADKAQEGVPFFVQGQSMGGLIALKFCKDYRNEFLIQGCIAMSPAISVPPSIRPGYIYENFIHLMGFLLSSFNVSSPVDPAGLSHDSQVVEEYKKDELIHPYISFGTASMLLKIGKELKLKKFPNLKILLTHGEGDMITCCEGTQEFYNRLTTMDKTLLLYKEMFHELHNEPAIREEIMQKYVDFIIERTRFNGEIR